MHDVVLELALYWLLGLAGACIALVVASPAAVTRIIVVDLLTTILIGALIVHASAERSPHFVAAAVVLSLLSFAVTLAATRFLGWGSIYR